MGVQIIEKKVPKIEYNYVQKIVEVPNIIYEERVIEEPVYEIFELIKKVPKPVYQFVDKKIPQTVNQYVEKIIQEDVVLTQEKPVEIPQIQTVELTTQVPKPVWQPIEKPVPQIQIQGHETVEQGVVTTRQEQPVEVPVPEMHELRVQVANIQHAGREVLRNPKTTHVVVKEEVVPVELKREKAQYVPQMQMIELIKEEPQITCKQVQKSIPKYEMKYINNVITVGPKYMEHVKEEEEVEVQETFEVIDKQAVLPEGVTPLAEPVIARPEPQIVRPATYMSQPSVVTRPTVGTIVCGSTGGYYTGGTVIGGTTGGYVTGGTVIGGTTGGYVTGGTLTGGYVTGAPIVSSGANTLFNTLDRNHDGVITRAEFAGAMR